MLAYVVLLSLSSANAWTFHVQTNLLNQPEAVAELPESPDAQGRYLKFSCSVLSGPVFEAGLGVRSFEEFTRFSADLAAKAKPVPLAIQPSNGAIVSVSAEHVAAQVTVHAFAVGGSEAATAATAISRAEKVTIASPEARADFSLNGATAAIGQVLDACPFKG